MRGTGNQPGRLASQRDQPSNECDSTHINVHKHMLYNAGVSWEQPLLISYLKAHEHLSLTHDVRNARERAALNPTGWNYKNPPPSSVRKRKGKTLALLINKSLLDAHISERIRFPRKASSIGQDEKRICFSPRPTPKKRLISFWRRPFGGQEKAKNNSLSPTKFCPSLDALLL